MLLCLSDDKYHRIDLIELKDGCFPLITIDIGGKRQCLAAEDDSSSRDRNCSVHPSQGYYVTNLEPAVWSIILLLDKINVDCGRRRVSWVIKGTENNEKDNGESSFKRSELEQEECYNYNDDVDQLFDLAYGLVKLSKSHTLNENEDSNQMKEERYSLIRMLYCYLLPNVQIYKEDRPKIVDAIQQQTLNIDKINNNLERDSQTLDELHNVLEMQQHDRLNQFEEIIREERCSKKFLSILKKDLEKRKVMLDSELEKCQNVVNHIKQDIKTNGSTSEKENNLSEARKQTAICQKTIEETLMMSRDTIKTALSGNTFVKKDTEKIILEYLESNEMLFKQKTKTYKQIDKKVRATSVFENLNRINKEIESNGVSGSTFHSHSGHRPTDVLPGTYFPEYQTLSERVSAIVQNPEHPLGIAFRKFTTNIREKCQEILEQPTECQKKRKTKDFDNYLLVKEDGSIQLEYHSALENLSRDIKEHFYIMTDNFQQHFQSSPYASKKLQLCYEYEFYNEVGKEISDVYTKVYEQHCVRTLNDLQVILKLPIDCLDLGMKDEYWLELFENRRKVLLSSWSSNHVKQLTESVENSSSSHSSNSSPDDSPNLKPRRRSKLRRVLNFIMKESRKVTSDNGAGAVEELNAYEWVVGPKLHLDGATDEIMKGDIGKAELKKFEEYFGPSLVSLQNIFEVFPIYEKLQCLTTAVRKVTDSVQELRRQILKFEGRGNNDGISLALTGDDMLPLIVLVILQMEPTNAAALDCQLRMIQDLIPDFLSNGVHGWAMMNFNGACCVLNKLCKECSWSNSFNSSCSSFAHINK